LNILRFFFSNEIIHRQNSHAPKSVFYEQSKPVYVWPKLHGGQSASFCTVQVLKNSVNNKEEFNLGRRGSRPKVKQASFLANIALKTKTNS